MPEKNKVLTPEILEGITTLKEAEVLRFSAQLLLDHLFLNDSQLARQALEEEIPRPYAGILREIMQKQGVDFAQREILRELLQRLQNELRSLKAVKVTLAFAPRPEFRRELKSLLERFFGTELLLALEREENLLGGMLLTSPSGKFMDLSLRRRLREKWADLWPKIEALTK